MSINNYEQNCVFNRCMNCGFAQKRPGFRFTRYGNIIPHRAEKQLAAEKTPALSGFSGIEERFMIYCTKERHEYTTKTQGIPRAPCGRKPEEI